MNILITGIHGFIGSNLVSALHNKHTLYGLDIVSPQKEGVLNTFNWDEFDIIPPIDIIIHLTGKAHDTKDQTKSQVYFDINTKLTEKIFDFNLTSGAKKFIFFSTVKAISDRVEGEILTEEVVPNPRGPYGESKLAAEQYIMDEWDKFRGEERATGLHGEVSVKKIYILRPCMIHGPGNKGNLNLLFKIQQKELPWPLGAFENKRSFCSIDNLLFVVQEIIEKNIEPGVYQVADDEAMSTNELIKIMAASQGKKARIWNIPARFIKNIARFGDYIHLPLNSERLKKLTESYQVSNRKIKLALGINKMPVTAVEGLRRTFESLQG